MTMQRTRIKICGITSVEAARAAIDAGADAIGCVFAPGSPRRISIDLAAEIISALPPLVTAIGVFQLDGTLDADLEQWLRMSPYAQLHGEEDENLVKRVRRRARVIRGFRFSSAQVRRWDACPHVEMLLIEGAAPGSGKRFDHSKLAAMMPQISKPVILAGGLDAQFVGEAVRAVRPFAVDVSSGVESKPGVKEPARMRDFCRAVRDADSPAAGDDKA